MTSCRRMRKKIAGDVSLTTVAGCEAMKSRDCCWTHGDLRNLHEISFATFED